METFVARDLVSYVDSHYRTLARRESRGLSGHSMGGYGTLRIGMKYPDVYNSLYAMSACCLEPRGTGPGDAALEKLASAQEVVATSIFARTTLAASAAWAPNRARPPFFMDLPTAGGQTQADVIARYAANAPTEMVSKHASQLKRYKAIVMDIGRADTLLPGNEAMVKALQRAGVQHRYETYEGDHTNKVPERFEQQVLPFFSGALKPDSTRASAQKTSDVGGYRLVVTDGNEMWCRPDEVLGSKVRRADVCFTAAQLEATRRSSEEFMRNTRDAEGAVSAQPSPR